MAKIEISFTLADNCNDFSCLKIYVYAYTVNAVDSLIQVIVFFLVTHSIKAENPYN